MSGTAKNVGLELLTQMEQFIKEQDPTYNCIIKVEQSYTAAHQS